MVKLPTALIGSDFKIIDIDGVVTAWRRIATTLAARSRRGGRLRDLSLYVTRVLFSMSKTGTMPIFFGDCPWGTAYSNPGVVRGVRRLAEVVEEVLACGVLGEAKEAAIVGMRGTGKSTLQEAAALLTLAYGGTVIDLFGARGGEQLGWLLYATGMAKETRVFLHCYVLRDTLCPFLLAMRRIEDPLDPYQVLRLGWPPAKVLIVVPDNVRVYASGIVARAYERGIVDVAHIRDILAVRPETIIKSYNVIVFPVDYYSLPGAFPNTWQMVAAVIHWLMQEPPSIRSTILMREAATIAYVRGKLDESQSKAKAYVARFAREARHMNMNMLFDTQRLRGVEANVREIVNSLVFKKLNPTADIGDELLSTLAHILFASREKDARQEVARLLSTLPNNQFIALTGLCTVIAGYSVPPNHCLTGQCRSIPLMAVTGGHTVGKIDLYAKKLLDEYSDVPEKAEKLTGAEIVEYAIAAAAAAKGEEH